MNIHEMKVDDDGSTGSKTYIEFNSDGSEAEREAYQLVRRGGRIRRRGRGRGGTLRPTDALLAAVMFEDDPTGLMAWLELDANDWEAYQDE